MSLRPLATATIELKLPGSLDAMMATIIETALTLGGGNVSHAARALGMHRRTLQRKIVKLRVRRHG